MIMVFVGISGAFVLSVDVVTNNKARAGAIALANERMEYLKSLSYTQIGVMGGIPAGNVAQLETMTHNGVAYTRRTLVFYSDDPGDGTGGADTNAIIADYKTIRVEASWLSKQGERSVEVVGRVSPNGVETAVTGGTLTINVVNAAAVPLSSAQVDIINTDTSPAISIRTYTDAGGSVTFIGAPAASNYQIMVSKIGHSTAQTYPVTVQNPNPDPRHLTVSNNQTTASTFAIDFVGQSTIETYRAIEERTWSDTYTDATNVATSTDIELLGGSVLLLGPVPYVTSGFVQSTTISSDLLAAWKSLSWTDTTPPGTDILYRVYDASGGTPALLSDVVLPGNSAGFTLSPVDISAISTSTYPSLRVSASLTTADTETTPSVHSLSLSYDYGPEAMPNTDFTVRGMKTIGNNPSVYKHDETHTTDGSATLTLSNREWDTYALGLPVGSAYDIAEACAPQPEALAPGASLVSRLYLAPNSAHSLLVDVRGSGTLLAGASVQLTGTSYDTTLMTGRCGQVFFSGLTNQTYSITVSRAGFQDFTSATIPVSGDIKLPVVLQP